MKLKISAKITLLVLLPLLIIAIVAIALAGNDQRTTAYQLISEKLSAVAWNIDSLYDTLSDGDYTYSDSKLKKGSTDLTEQLQLIDTIKERSDIEVTIFWGNERALTTVTDEEGNRAVGTTLDSDFATDLLSGKKEYHFTKDVVIANEDYCGYYIPLTQSNGDIVGLIFAGRSKTEVDKSIRQNQNRLFYAMLVAFIAACICAIVYARGIIRSLNRSMQHLDHVADGKLQYEIPQKLQKRSDEIGDMSRSIQQLITSLRAIIYDLTHSSSSLNDFSANFEQSFANISDSITSINTAINEVANGATSQANETLKTNHEIGDMGVAIENSTEQVIQLNANSDKMRDYSSLAENTLVELVDISMKNNEEIEKVKQQTNLTNESAQAIQLATDIITSIAEQTNLLSLNASIEAARAGDSGRGFAVVANEIRELAEQSRQSAEKICSVVADLLHNSANSVESMNKVSAYVSNQNDKLLQTKDIFVSLNDEIEQVSTGVNQIHQNIENLDTIKQSVMLSVEQLASIAEENAASAEETSASMSVLHDIVNQCTEDTRQLSALSAELNSHTEHFTLAE